MKAFPKTLLVCLCGTTLFGAGAVLSAQRGWFQPVVTMKIENRSGQVLRALEVTYESGQTSSIATLPKLAANETLYFHFYVRGEGGYKVNALLGDGTAMKASEGYVESGYYVSEVITTSQIVGTPK
jgi:hypothetical protein